MEQIIKQYIYGELVTNIHAIQTPAVKKYKANTTNIHVDKTGIVLRAGVFRRFNYMCKHYSFHFDRYTHRSELHGDMVDHGQPVMGIFHRPRTEAHLIEEQGLNPKEASFQFLDIASSDMGPWMQYLLNNEGWKRLTIEIYPTPIT